MPEPIRSILISIIVIGCGILSGGCGAVWGGDRSPTFRGVVAADHYLASEAGAEMLRAGGNAVDAAVATSFALSVVRPYSCGIGGGGFMVIHLEEGSPRGPRGREGGRSSRQFAIDYRETAPAALSPEFYEHLPDDASRTGGRAIGTPGTVAGLLHALESYGTLSRRQVLAPAIRLAEEGFAVDQHYVNSVQPLIRRFTSSEGGDEMQARFGFVWERFLKRGEISVGDRIELPEQGRVLRRIARDGAAGFYEGPVAEAIVRAVQEDAGVLTMEDLEAYWIRERTPVRFTFAEHTFVTMPPPSSGGIAMAQTLGIMEILDPSLASEGSAAGLDAARRTPAFAHLLVESLKHAFADRAEWLADPDFVDVPLQRLLSPDYLRERAATFTPSRTLDPEAYGTREGEGRALLPEGAGTSHISVVDQWGNAVACTETINLTFGSLLAVEEFGFVLNNEMDDFTTRRGQPNAFGLRQSDRNLPEARKRPLSSMTPTVVLDPDGRVRIVAGASGGPRIITATLQCILNALAGDDAAQAVAAPRLHHQWAPDVVRVERGFDAGVADDLSSRGHSVERGGDLGNVQAIVRRGGAVGGAGDRWTAASDPRKGGRPAGH